MAGDDDDLGVGVDLLELAQQLETVGIRQHHVGDDDVRLPGLEDFLAPRADHRGPDFVALMLEQDLQPLDHRRLVVYGEHPVLLLGGHQLIRVKLQKSAQGLARIIQISVTVSIADICRLFIHMG